MRLFLVILAFILAFPDQGLLAFRTIPRGGVDEFESTEDSFASGNTSNKLRVELLFVRHGHACHNALHYQTVMSWGVVPSGSINHCNWPDPLLSDCGLALSERSGTEIRDALQGWHPDFVGSSSMLRAMETAMALFPQHKVFPLPFISEIGRKPCNQPLDLASQQSIMVDRPVDWKFVTNSMLLNDPRISRNGAHSRLWEVNQARATVSYKDFRAFLGEKVIPALLESGSDAWNKTRVVRLVVVGHSKFLSRSLLTYFRCPVYLVNNAAQMVYFDYDTHFKKLSESTSGGEKCTSILRRPSHHWNKNYLCPRDYDRCFAEESRARPGWEMKPGKVQDLIRAPEPGSMCCDGSYTPFSPFST